MPRYKFAAHFGSASVDEEKVRQQIDSFDAAAWIRMKKIAEIFDSKLSAFRSAKTLNSNPFLLAGCAYTQGLIDLSDLQSQLITSRNVHGLETAMGKIMEDVAVEYGWEKVPSKSHSSMSEIDHTKELRYGQDKLFRSIISMKSGGVCINDTVTNKIASSVCDHLEEWAAYWNSQYIEFILGLTYGTPKTSSKKNWHAIRLVEEKMVERGATIVRSCVAPGNIARPVSSIIYNGIRLVMATAQGIKFWSLLSRPDGQAYVEICYALAYVLKKKHNADCKEWFWKLIRTFGD
jgi:hypothetical protein